MKKQKKSNVNFYLPTDVIVADEFKNDTNYKTVSVENIPKEKIGLDIGSESIQKFSEVIYSSKTILWNGPMGVFEMENFAKGTEKIAEALASVTEQGAISLVGGGDSASAVKKLGFYDKISHVSTGGGASLELISGIQLPAVTEISKK
ncbi:MAG: phosphoglycerate kinase [Candidatus Marinimicrobia bacterium]|nr:phosphoglycerate kinase [Candidatus Neomarinimicrobiota bacterium]